MPLIEPGGRAPAFSLKDQHGRTHRLSDYAGRLLVLYFYPKDDTPGCTKESCDFQASLPRLEPAKAAVLGVSILDEASKAQRKARHLSRRINLLGVKRMGVDASETECDTQDY